MLSLIKKAYGTYRGDKAFHKTRVVGSLLISTLVGIFSTNLTKDSFTIMTFAISVLAGFSYTAMFSNYSMASSGLKKDKNETDRHDIQKLKILGENFGIRSDFFIFICIFEILFIFFASINLPHDLLLSYLPEKMKHFAVVANDYLYVLLKSLTVFLFLEAIYTFYRLSETIIAIIRIRNNYSDH